MPSPTPADAVIENLLRGDKLASGKNVVGPLSPSARRLLQAIWAGQTDLAKRKGADQVNAARTSYLAAATDTPGLTPEPGPAADPPPRSVEPPSVASAAPRRWRLFGLWSHSIRGIAPRGVTVEFPFDGVPMLIYGPNGSGKSSLLTAVGWVLTGRVVTDGDEDVETFTLYAPPTPTGRVVKVTDWPVVHTLPNDAVPAAVAPDCWAEIELRAEAGGHTLHLKRSLARGLEQSDDGVSWTPCPSLSPHGISPLDVQLSVIAATVFGRRSLETAPDTRHVLSMMLGYDSLEDLGNFITTFATNLTKAAKAERGELTEMRQRLRLRLSSLPAELRDGLELARRLTGLVGDDQPDVARINESIALATESVATAEGEVASLLGIGGDSRAVPAGLAVALTAAVAALETSIDDLFPTTHALRATSVEGGGSPDEAVAAAEEALVAFERAAAVRIADRLAWWKREAIPGSKASLLIRAAEHYEPAAEACPVCEQPITGAAVAAQLAGLKEADAGLRSGLREFFNDLTDELRRVVPAAVLDLGDKDPARSLRADWVALCGKLGPALAPVSQRFGPAVEAVAEGLPPIEFVAADLIPADADGKFAAAATTFLTALRGARRGVAVAGWVARNLPALADRLAALILTNDGAESSLLGTLTRGRSAAADVNPMVTVRDALREAAGEATDVTAAAAALTALEEMQTALDAIKPLGKYAAAEVEQVFTTLCDATIGNYAKLYPSANPALTLSRLHMKAGRDKSVEPYLSAGPFEVPGRHVANAGSLRAIALAFYFALLERHPGGLGFVVMDDPILSLDEDHREAWSANVLRPLLETSQVVVATHQR